MAHRLLQAAMETADLVVDLHSGGAEAVVPFYSLYWEDGSKASQAAKRYAHSAGTDVVWAAKDEWLSGAMFTQLTRNGLPGVIVECGGGGEMPEAHIDTFVQAIVGIAGEAGIIAGAKATRPRYRTIGSCDLAYTCEGGFFLPSCAAGDTLEEGDIVGRVVDVFGREREVIKTPKHAFVAAIGRPYYPVQSGAMVAELNDDHGWATPTFP
jgi:predicted deacylase